MDVVSLDDGLPLRGGSPEKPVPADPLDKVVPYEQSPGGKASTISEAGEATALEAEQPPAPRLLRGSKGGPPVELAVSVKWKSVTALRIVDQSFDAEVDITFETPDHEGIDEIDPGFFEKGPNVTITNAISVDYRIDMRSEDERAGRKSGKRRIWKILAQGTFFCTMRVSDFPFDLQECSIKLKSEFPAKQTEESNKRFVTLSCKKGETAKVVHEGILIGQNLFTVLGLAVRSSLTDAAESRNGLQYSEVCAVLFAERRPNHFIWNAVIPTTLVTTFAGMSFELDLVPRVDLCATIFLTIVAQRISLSSALPETDTMTHIDKYLNVSIIFIFLAMIMNRLAPTVGHLILGPSLCCLEAISTGGKKLQSSTTCTTLCPTAMEDTEQECVEQSLLGEMYRFMTWRTTETRAVYSRYVPDNCIELQTVKYFLALFWMALYLGFTFSLLREWRRIRKKNRLQLLESRRTAAESSSNVVDPKFQTWFDSDEPDEFANRLVRNRLSFLEEEAKRPRFSSRLMRRSSMMLHSASPGNVRRKSTNSSS
jgi:hypothetical protein